MKNLLMVTPESVYDESFLFGQILSKETCRIVSDFITRVALTAKKTGIHVDECIWRFEKEINVTLEGSVFIAIEHAKTKLRQKLINSEVAEPHGRYAMLPTSKSNLKKYAA